MPSQKEITRRAVVLSLPFMATLLACNNRVPIPTETPLHVPPPPGDSHNRVTQALNPSQEFAPPPPSPSPLPSPTFSSPSTPTIVIRSPEPSPTTAPIPTPQKVDTPTPVEKQEATKPKILWEKLKELRSSYVTDSKSLVYLYSDKGKLGAYNLQNGSLSWEASGQIPKGSDLTPDIYSENLLYARNGKNINIVDVQTGRVKTNVDMAYFSGNNSAEFRVHNGVLEILVSVFNSVKSFSVLVDKNGKIPFIKADGRLNHISPQDKLAVIYSDLDTKGIYVTDLATGKQKKTLYSDVSTKESITHAHGEDNLFFGLIGNNLPYYNPKIAAYDIKNQERVWEIKEKDLPGYKYLYYPENTTNLYALHGSLGKALFAGIDKKTGKIVFDSPYPQNALGNKFFGIYEGLAVTSGKPKLPTVGINTKTGFVWQNPEVVFDNIYGTVNKILVGRSVNDLYGLDVDTGQIVWKTQFKPQLGSPSAVLHKSNILAGQSVNKTIYLLDATTGLQTETFKTRGEGVHRITMTKPGIALIDSISLTAIQI